MPPENEDAGAGAGTNTDAGASNNAAANQGRQGGGDAASELTQQLSSERSANALVKDFAKARGVTVSQLLEQFKSAEDAQKTEVQRLSDQKKEIEQQHADALRELQAERAEKAIRDAAAGAGARADRLAVIYRAVRADVQYDDKGKPSNVAALIEQAKADAPEFFQPVSGSGDGGKGGGGSSNPNDAVNAAIRRAAGVSGQ